MKALTDGQLRTLLQSYGLNPEDVRHLGGGREDSDGIVYAFDRGGKPMALKLMAVEGEEPQYAETVAAYEERARFARYLSEGGAAILGPEPDAEGLLYRACRQQNLTCISYLMRRVDGAAVPPERWDDDFFTAWGRAVGRMHRLSTAWPQHQHSLAIDAAGQPLICWRNEVGFFRRHCRDAEVSAAWARMQAELESLPVERDSFGFIHNDPHGQNLLCDGQSLYLIDFDVANYHWFATDLPIAAQSVLFAQSGGLERPLLDAEALRRFLRAFFDGYRQEYALDSQWMNRLDLFLQYRRLLLFTVMQDWLDTNPPVRDAWKAMIAEAPAVLTPLL
jgi:Ser/Thr protein kinase RdoA (MazF antagonist)